MGWREIYNPDNYFNPNTLGYLKRAGSEIGEGEFGRAVGTAGRMIAEPTAKRLIDVGSGAAQYMPGVLEGLLDPLKPAAGAPVNRTAPTTREPASSYRGPRGPAGDMRLPTMTAAMYSPEVTKASRFTPDAEIVRGRPVRTIDPKADPNKPTLQDFVDSTRGMNVAQLSALAQLMPKPAAPRSFKEIAGVEALNAIQGGFLNDVAAAQGNPEQQRAANNARLQMLMQLVGNDMSLAALLGQGVAE